jgi:hypothetical protein
MSKDSNTGKEIRNLGYLSWKDPLAWMELMKGAKWDAVVRQENRHYNTLVTQPIVAATAKKMEKELHLSKQYEVLPFLIGAGTIQIYMKTGSKFEWRWVWKKKRVPAYDLDVKGNIVWYITSDEDTTYKNQLICEDSTGKHIWTKDAVSSQIAIIGDRCYYIKVVNYFQTIELCVCNAHTGWNERVIYREKDDEKDLQLLKTANHTLYMTSADPSHSSLYRIKGEKLTPLYKNSNEQFPIGESIYNEECVLTRQSPYSKWIAHGRPVTQWHIPNEEIQWINLESGLIVTIQEGEQTIWHAAVKQPSRPLFKIKAGSIQYNPWTLWENSMIQTFLIKSPFDIPFMIQSINTRISRIENTEIIEHPIVFPALDVHRFHAISHDSTAVPYILIKEKGIKPKAQLIYVYGAYGSTTPVDWPYKNWGPILRRKWAIVFAMVRGGGDTDAAWAENAKRENRHVAVEDFVAVIEHSKKKLRLPAEKTVIYGRSAGGVPIGSVIARYPDGSLAGAAFTEAPYVDILRTSSNPDLPLTVGEYKEFGNPRERLVDFKELLTVSPINSLSVSGAPGVFVISRVGLLDRQVLAYESFKWIQRLRGNSTATVVTVDRCKDDPMGKYVTLLKNEAHQHTPKHFPKIRATDLAILDAWVDGKLKI